MYTIWERLTLLQGVIPSHIYREANKVADSLASTEHSHKQKLQYVDQAELPRLQRLPSSYLVLDHKLCDSTRVLFISVK